MGKTIYTNAKLFVIQNVFFFIFILIRDVNKELIFHIIFYKCVEIISIMIKQNKDIKKLIKNDFCFNMQMMQLCFRQKRGKFKISFTSLFVIFKIVRIKAKLWKN